jgi:hypothetical protein
MSNTLKRRFYVWGALFGFGLVLMLGTELAFASPFAEPNSTAAETAAALRNKLNLTATAVRNNVSGTATAVRNNVSGTATAIRNNVSGTATAVRDDVSGTATAIRNNVSGTATAIRNNISGTATALAPHIGGTATAIVGTLKAIETKYAVTKVPGGDAQVALTSYGTQVLGVDAQITNAVGWTGSVNQNTPIQIRNAQLSAAQLALSAYVGRIAPGGEAFVASSVGAVTTTNNIPITVQDASFGLWTLPSSTRPTSASAALALATATYPSLAGFTYAPEPVTNGYGFYAYTTAVTIDAQTGQVKTSPQAIFLSVILGTNQSYVSAAVGRGDFATTIKPQ